MKKNGRMGNEKQRSERQVEKFQRSVKTTEDAMRLMQERVMVFQKLFLGPVSSNWHKMSIAFSTLGQSFHTDENSGSHKMVDALAHTSRQYYKIKEEFEAHAKNDMERLVENLYSFKGTVQAVPDILHVHKQAVQKLRENDGKVSHADSERIKQRVDSTSYAVLAEMNHLNTEKACDYVEDLRVTMGSYLRKQAEFYQKIANNLNEQAKHYEF
uniref:BAR_3_WASP_bdg domain-containing protein n=1 Tax=Heterorhabditis bacteriophora TaxID=37862 RepID=A0A1I7XJP0_HETBA